jgi:hypothetical protein
LTDLRLYIVRCIVGTLPSQTMTHVNRDGENLESSMIINNVLSLPRSIFVINYPVLCVESLPLQKIVSSDGNAIRLTNHILTKLGSESNYYGAMLQYA